MGVNTMTSRNSALLVFASTLLSIALAGMARADDSEIFYGSGGTSIGPNVLLVIDNSGSMSTDAPITSSSYTSTTTYSGGCANNTVYFLTKKPASNWCSSAATLAATPQVAIANFQCTIGLTALNSVGSFNDTFTRWAKPGWSKTFSNGNGYLTNDVACDKDYTSSSSSGTTAGNGHGYPELTSTSKNPSKTEWTTTSSLVWWAGNTGATYTAYSGNYLNYLLLGSGQKLTKLQVVQNEMSALLPLLPDNWNVALMTYNYASGGGSSGVASSLNGSNAVGSCGNGGGNGYGGCVLVPFGPMSDNTHQNTLINTINGLQAIGNTPLVGTLYEAYRYMEGLGESFGKYADVSSCATTSTAPSNSYTPVYQSPVVAANASCTHNYVVFLTDGLPNESPSYADKLIYSGLYGSTAAKVCTDGPLIPSQALCLTGSTINGGTCLSGLTSYMNQTPSSAASTTATYPIETYFLAFGVDPCLLLGFNYISAAAQAGGGTAYSVQSGDDLIAAFDEITTQVLAVNTSFTAPTVALNAFNRTQTLNDLFISMFEPNTNYHWAGNLKHYTLSNSGTTAGQIVDSKGNLAVSNGFIASTAYSAFGSEQSTDADGYTTAVNDGANVNLGGAAQLLPCWQQRYVFTYINSSTAYTSPIALGTVPSTQVAGTAIPCPTSGATQATSTSTHQLSTGNTLLTSTVMGIPASDTTTKAADVIDFALGADYYNAQKTNVTTGSTTTYGTRLTMGDTLHGQPGYVFYGDASNLSNTSLANAYIYTTDNDGFLHAINALTGQEAWAFVPQDLLDNLYTLYQNPVEASKSYTLDGSVQVLKYDQNGNGVIDGTNDRVIIYFSSGRGGSNYYALDVTNPLAPKFMWTIGPTQLPGVGQTWSTPTIAKVNTGLSAQVSNQKLVLIFGGGYDPSEDSQWNTTDSVGNSIYMVDALSGALLWQGLLSTASTTAPSSTLLANMTNAIPSPVLVLDTNGDGYADRMYVGDLGGQLWRFDITNYTSTVPFAVNGGVIASLGGQIQNDSNDQRRFYEPPDIALVQNTGQALFFDIAIGSGYRGHPLSLDAYDRLYSIRDFSPLTVLTKAQYSALKVIVDASVSPSSSQQALTDITAAANADTTPTIAANAPGWQYDLSAAGSADGEKVLAQASIFNNTVLFTTYTPASTPSSATSCAAPQIGTNKLYALGVTNGAQIAALSTSTGGTSGTSSPYVTLQQTGIAPTLQFLFPGAGTGSTTGQVNITCTAGVEVLSICKSFNSVVKTYWTEQDSK